MMRIRDAATASDAPYNVLIFGSHAPMSSQNDPTMSANSVTATALRRRRRAQ